MTKVLKFHKEGFNCAESMVKAMNEEKKLNIPISIASPFGTGMSVCSTCGAVTGALMVLGAIKGRETLEEVNESRRAAREIMSRVKEEYGTYECLELKKKGVSCSEIIKYTYDVLQEYV
ncbi:putative redox-active protein [Clostridium tepidiprofundi DSM 19306]|uniref:Putative redox-active protein n=1 Tax=Clostridium tepidiprofundi DSM 19306 TaxID=1121338 RepID=A0A151B2P1_9CLOT|nr:C-GCAxxG-C-C family (seleno)protein [Clostridium tepidiprofundi]KYH34199.1 putative redox-active protein [Clostridium tepidiprofundi DSM 19306]